MALAVESIGRREESRNMVMAMDEIELLNAYRRAKTFKYADLIISIQEGLRVKLWLTEKMK